MKSIITQKERLKGKKVLLRLSLNVPVDDGKVINDFKLEKILPTIEFLRNEGAKILIIGYIGSKKIETLKPVAEYFKQFFKFEFIEDILDNENSKIISKMENGGVIIFENIRKYDENKTNDEEFVKKIASLGDIYVNEAFPDSHRKSATIFGLPKLMESYFGPQFIKEVERLCSVAESERPRLFILGGNKLNTKLPYVKRFTELADFVFVGGSLANDFFKLKGYEVGKSLVSNEEFGLGDLLNHKKIILPVDVMVQSAEGIFIRKVREVLQDDIILDAGPETIHLLEEKIKQAKFILWNGPIGDYKKGFMDGTLGLVQAIANSKAESVAGGGDTVFCIEKLGLKDQFDFLSTGGGSMLDFINEGTLPGIEAQK
ncbi:phosphoglycerate kinase [Patescibacteria group bacterium]|nr:phosphoglycerate kinase [Patescibacteria group bacterium]